MAYAHCVRKTFNIYDEGLDPLQL